MIMPAAFTLRSNVMLHIRQMTVEDVPVGMRLREHAGFNQTEADWRRFLALEPQGCFVGEWDGEAVGTVANFVFGSIGWIAMLLVDKRFRGRGIGTRLMQHAMVYLDERRVATMRLDATPMGRPIYEKLGFVAEYELARLEGVASGGGAHEDVQQVLPDQLEKVLALDEQVTGTKRGRLIRRLCHESPEEMYVVTDGKQVMGYLTSRTGTSAAQIGPGVALGEAAGRTLADTAIQRLAGQPVFIDIPLDNVPAVHWAESRGLTVQRPFTRMRRGEPVIDDPVHVWASSGPEKG
jgi:ribosomal protein S18 acetylase RimI-like enzyme